MKRRGTPKQTWKRVIGSGMSLLGIEEGMASDRAELRERIYAEDMI